MQLAASSEFWGKGLELGQTLGRYELLLPVAKGGMAQVWAARLKGTRGFRKLVAVKTILSDAIDDAQLEQMFLQEATLASQIQHPNVAATLDLGEENGLLYLVMEWVDGESIQYVMSRAAALGGIPLPISVNLVGQACKGLHAAHETRDESGTLLGIVHRDISPQNILVSYSGTVQLVDFGIAKATAHAPHVTEARQLKGKLSYMAPEQIRRQPLDRRTDIFALGTVLYYLVTGRHPFRGDNPAETLQRICFDDRLTPPSQLEPSCPERLQDAILKALAKRPSERFSTAHDLLSALEGAMPQALEGSFEARVAQYLGTVLSDRRQERCAALRAAREQLGVSDHDESSRPSDPARSEAPSGIGQARTATEPATDGTPSQARRIASTTRAAPRLRILPQLLIAAGFLVGTLAIGTFVLRVGRGSHSETAPVKAVPAAREPAGRGEPERAAPSKAAEVRAVAAPSASAVTSTTVARATASTPPARAAPPRMGIRYRAPVAHSVKAATPAVSASAARSTPASVQSPMSTAESSTAASPPDSAAKPELDAWDADNFGGRR